MSPGPVSRPLSSTRQTENGRRQSVGSIGSLLGNASPRPASPSAVRPSPGPGPRNRLMSPGWQPPISPASAHLGALPPQHARLAAHVGQSAAPFNENSHRLEANENMQRLEAQSSDEDRMAAMRVAQRRAEQQQHQQRRQQQLNEQEQQQQQMQQRMQQQMQQQQMQQQMQQQQMQQQQGGYGRMPPQYPAQQDYGQMPQQMQQQLYEQEQQQQQMQQQMQQYAQGQEQPQPQPPQQQPYSGQQQFERPQPDWSLLASLTPAPAAKPYASPSGLAAPNPDSEVEPRRSRRATPIDPNPSKRAAGADRERISDSREFAEKEGQLGRKERADLGAHLEPNPTPNPTPNPNPNPNPNPRQPRAMPPRVHVASEGARAPPQGRRTRRRRAHRLAHLPGYGRVG